MAILVRRIGRGDVSEAFREVEHAGGRQVHGNKSDEVMKENESQREDGRNDLIAGQRGREQSHREIEQPHEQDHAVAPNERAARHVGRSVGDVLEKI